MTAAGLYTPAGGAETWQLQPFCNRVTVSVTRYGGVYTPDGFVAQALADARQGR